ncbi:MAG: heme-binding domain-containing protein [Verrucomicrobia bacterium]|nr:heme-binding domain-containing protein [Verrucomicrobiota bacterium]MDE3099790.1 heme-binding domain-containing protein [Verrucomicrobiota bacterium]
MKKRLKWILGVALVVMAALQFTNPSLTNPNGRGDFLAAMQPPPALAAEFRAACYDCHSDQTRWPWYSRVAPVSWLIASDVSGGRHHLNFSEWPTNRPSWEAHRMADMSTELDYNDMPPLQYKIIHSKARLTKQQRQQLEGWLDAMARKLRKES